MKFACDDGPGSSFGVKECPRPREAWMRGEDEERLGGRPVNLVNVASDSFSVVTPQLVTSAPSNKHTDKHIHHSDGASCSSIVTFVVRRGRSEERSFGGSRAARAERHARAMLLPDQTYEGAGSHPPPAPAPHTPLAALLRAHRVRPDFFCTYRPGHVHGSRSSAPLEEKRVSTSELARSRTKTRDRTRGRARKQRVQYSSDSALCWYLLVLSERAVFVKAVSSPRVRVTTTEGSTRLVVQRRGDGIRRREEEEEGGGAEKGTLIAFGARAYK
ncbi:unnamed protein product [Danaus chrysippus]|uniref:(African queen) hypothetical protein n=1 Tax=Danaus chrysippus TaxID=151541 RepID=A0A8J2VQ59_9NEOP|nr:unnamed protein product [Danaus chrysippus]